MWLSTLHHGNSYKINISEVLGECYSALPQTVCASILFRYITSAETNMTPVAWHWRHLLHLLFMESSISDATGKVIHSLALHYVWQNQLLACHSITTHPCEISHLQVSQLEQRTQSWQFWDSHILKQTSWIRPSVWRKYTLANICLAFWCTANISQFLIFHNFMFNFSDLKSVILVLIFLHLRFSSA